MVCTNRAPDGSVYCRTPTGGPCSPCYDGSNRFTVALGAAFAPWMVEGLVVVNTATGSYDLVDGGQRHHVWNPTDLETIADHEDKRVPLAPEVWARIPEGAPYDPRAYGRPVLVGGPVAVPCPSVANGAVVLNTATGSMDLVSGGQRHHIWNAADLAALGVARASVVDLSAACWSAIPEGAPYAPPAGGTSGGTAGGSPGGATGGTTGGGTGGGTGGSTGGGSTGGSTGAAPSNLFQGITDWVQGHAVVAAVGLGALVLVVGASSSAGGGRRRH